MRIHQMQVTPVATIDPPLLNAAGLHAPYALRVVVELVTDNGISGLGEVPGSSTVIEGLQRVREVVVGADPWHTTALLQQIAVAGAGAGHPGGDERGESPWDRRTLVHVLSAVEVACLDIAGKHSGRPVVDLLGGAARDRVPFAAYLFFKHAGAGGALEFDLDPAAVGWNAARQAQAISPQEVVAQAQGMCAEFGFASIKLKGGAFAPDHEADAIEALAEAFGPGMPLRLDPNAIWKPATGERIARRLRGVLEYLEDPVRGQEEMAALRQKVDLPLATNMCTTSFTDLPGSVRLGSEDIILLDHHYWGGLRASMELSRFCAAFDRGLSMHSNSHLGISLAAMTHLGAAVPTLSHALDTHYPWQSQEVIAGGRVAFDEGSLPAPTAPGLGVELDRDALARLHQQYLDCGLTERNDAVEMQKVQPGWTFQALRW